MKIFYCYSMPLKNFLKSKNIHPIFKDPKINLNSKKYYWEYEKGEELDWVLRDWKNNKIKAINYLKKK